VAKKAPAKKPVAKKAPAKKPVAKKNGQTGIQGSVEKNRAQESAQETHAQGQEKGNPAACW